MITVTAPATVTLSPLVTEALTAPGGWFIAAMWRNAGEGPWQVCVIDTRADTEDESDEDYRAHRDSLSESFIEGHDGFLVQCPTNAAVLAAGIAQYGRLARYQRGMIEVLDGALDAE